MAIILGLIVICTIGSFVLVIGVDPSTTAVGWSVLKDGVLIMSGVISPCKKSDLIERRYYIRRCFNEALSNIINAVGVPDCVGIEDPMSIGIGVAKKLIMIKTMLEEIVFKYDLVHIDVRPSDWHKMLRKMCIESNIANKDVKKIALSEFMRRNEMKVATQDEADSYWIAMFVEHYGMKI